MMMFDMGLFVVGIKYCGEFEECFKKFMDEVKSDENIIFFIDEVYTFIGVGAAEGVIDVVNILKLVLVCGEF